MQECVTVTVPPSVVTLYKTLDEMDAISTTFSYFVEMEKDHRCQSARRRRTMNCRRLSQPRAEGGKK